MLGKLELQAGPRNWYTVYGGPIVQAPRHMTRVKLAPEVWLKCQYEVSIKDFCIPSREQIDQVLPQMVADILAGKPVYVGCFGGKGRTGLVLSILAKAFGEPAPIPFVRTYYYPHAVETKGQEQFVRDYEVPKAVRKAIFWARVKAWFQRGGNLTAML